MIGHHGRVSMISSNGTEQVITLSEPLFTWHSSLNNNDLHQDEMILNGTYVGGSVTDSNFVFTEISVQPASSISVDEVLYIRYSNRLKLKHNWSKEGF